MGYKNFLVLHPQNGGNPTSSEVPTRPPPRATKFRVEPVQAEFYQPSSGVPGQALSPPPRRRVPYLVVAKKSGFRRLQHQKCLDQVSWRFWSCAPPPRGLDQGALECITTGTPPPLPWWGTSFRPSNGKEVPPTHPARHRTPQKSGRPKAFP